MTPDSVRAAFAVLRPLILRASSPDVILDPATKPGCALACLDAYFGPPVAPAPVAELAPPEATPPAPEAETSIAEPDAPAPAPEAVVEPAP